MVRQEVRKATLTTGDDYRWQTAAIKQEISSATGRCALPLALRGIGYFMLLSEITKKVRQQGIWHSIVRLRQKLWPLQVSYVYSTKTYTDYRSQITNLAVHRYGSIGDIDGSTAKMILDSQGEFFVRHIRRVFTEGMTLWVGSIEGWLVSVCWSRTGFFPKRYFVPLTASDATVFGCFVVPAFRGMGIYPTMLKRIVNFCLSEGKQNVFIDSKSWNKASIRGIEKAGFCKLGSAWRFKVHRCVWVFFRTWERSS